MADCWDREQSYLGVIGARAIAELVPGLVGWEELADVDDVPALSARVAALFRGLRGRPDVSTLLAAGECFYEVPFSCRLLGRPGENSWIVGDKPSRSMTGLSISTIVASAPVTLAAATALLKTSVAWPSSRWISA